MTRLATDEAGNVRADGGDEDGFYTLRVAAVRRESNDTVSVIFDIPESLEERFAYRAGQYLTLRVPVDGKQLNRCYSMSTAPGVDPTMRVTIKQVAEGRASRWLNESLAAGDSLKVMAPAGRFCLRDHDGPVILFGAGSGITPLISLAKAALASTGRRVTLVYVNRDRESVIFADELDAIAEAHQERFTLIHWLDVERGLIDAAGVRALDVFEPGSDFYICGPTPFMHIVETTVLATGADREHVFVEHFVSPPDDDAPPEPAGPALLAGEPCEKLTITLRGEERQLEYKVGDTIVEAARRVGLRPPVSCLQGECGTCIARVTKGSVVMYFNGVLTPSEVEQGYVLTCQSMPSSKDVAVVFEE